MTSLTFIVSLVYKQKDFILLCMSGLEKGPASCLGQVDFPVRQVPLSFSLALGPRQVTCQQSHNNEKKKDLPWVSWNSRYFQSLHLLRCQN